MNTQKKVKNMNENKFLSKYLLILIIALLPIQQLHSMDNTSNSQKAIAITAAVAGIAYTGYLYAQQPITPIIDVKNLATKKGNFPTNFQWGASTASTQCEEQGDHAGDHSWSRSYLDEHEKADLQAPQFVCKSWEHWQDDIDKVKHLGCNSYRCSIAWNRIQPTETTFDQDAINHYVQVAHYCKQQNIKMMCCLHHYADPVWFLEKCGFSQEENLALFTTYCEKMHEALHEYVNQWIVFSQPVAYALKGYKVAMQPPFLKDSGCEDTVMLNMFKTHIAVYDMMHAHYEKNKTGEKPEVGLCHQIVQMKAANPYNPLDILVAQCADRLNNQTILRTFTDGHFQSLLPMIDIAYLSEAPTKFDFFALSYYAPRFFSGIQSTPAQVSDELISLDAFRTIDTLGMYDAIVQASKFGKPVYVVENGINPKNEAQRELLLNSYLSAISQAITDGYDVRGYLHWTLMDNYEWGKKTDTTQAGSAFGLYKNRVINDDTGELDPDFKNHDAMLKQSGLHYKNIIAMQS